MKSGLAGGLAVLCLAYATPTLATEFWQVDQEGNTAILDADTLKDLPGNHRFATLYFVPPETPSDDPQWLTARQIEMDCGGARVRITHMRELNRNLATVNEDAPNDSDQWQKADEDDMGRALVNLVCAVPADRARFGMKLPATTFEEAMAPFLSRVLLALPPVMERGQPDGPSDVQEEPSCAPGGTCSTNPIPPERIECDANGACDAGTPAQSPRDRIGADPH